MLKKYGMNAVCVLLALAILVSLAWGVIHRGETKKAELSDGISLADVNEIRLEGSKVKVNFSEVLLSDPNETRKLIVSTQTGMASTELTSSMINNVYWDVIKKNQKITYHGTGYFVVDLDKLTPKDVVQDEAAKTVTIHIGHTYLETVDIDPNRIIIDEVKKGLLAWGDIELSMTDYNMIEKELRQRLEDQFNTPANAQRADEIALNMVKGVYEPIVHAIDDTYEVIVKFG